LCGILALCACDRERYELKEDKNGRLVRLDRKTGELALVERDGVTREIRVSVETKAVIPGAL